MSEEQSLSSRSERLEDIVFAENVLAERLDDYRIVIRNGVQEPIATLVKSMNHRVKGPIILLKDEQQRYWLWSVNIRPDVYLLKGSRGGKNELDVLSPIIQILEADLDVEVVAFGMRGTTITQTGFEEFSLMLDSTPIARMHCTMYPIPGAVMVTNRGIRFWITLPGESHTERFQSFAESMIPSFVAVSWQSERNRREALKAS